MQAVMNLIMASMGYVRIINAKYFRRLCMLVGKGVDFKPNKASVDALLTC